MKTRYALNTWSKALAALLLCVGTARSETESADNPRPKGFFWQVKSDSATVYLMGTIHVGKPDFYPLSQAVQQAFAESAALAVEADMRPEKQADFIGRFMAAGMLPADESLQDKMTAETRKLYDAYLEKQENKAMGFLLQRMRPWMASVTITMLEFQRIGFNPEHGLDLHFIKAAAAAGKEIIELESAEQQLTLFSGLDTKTEALMLHQSLEQADTAAELIGNMIAAWKKGDDAALHALIHKEFLENKTLAPMKKALFTDRDDKMTEKIETYLQARRTVFVAVGSAHLIGPEGIVERLRKSKNVKVEITRL